MLAFIRPLVNGKDTALRVWTGSDLQWDTTFFAM